MPPLLRPSPPLSKEPPDRPTSYLPLSAAPATIDTSPAMNSDHHSQPPASPSIRPPFNPFFTLIHDTATSTTHHPRNVHYIFSDDDPSLLTTACLSALSPQPPASPTASSSSPDPRTPATNPFANATHAITSSSSTTASKSPPSPPAARENRVLLVDLDDSGCAVARANSLSSSWQILSTTLTPAPTWDEASSPAASGGAGFMLKISGTDARQMAAAAGVGLGLGVGVGRPGPGKAEGAVTDAEFQALMLEFDARMKVLRTVVKAGSEARLLRQGAGEEGEAAVGGGGEDAGPGGDT